jgi:phosphoglycerol transferase
MSQDHSVQGERAAMEPLAEVRESPSADAVAAAGTPSAPRGRRWLCILGPYVLAAVLCFLTLFAVYQLNQADLRIPLGWKRDFYFHQALIRNFAETGHWYVNPLLGAPGQQELYDFPLPHSSHLLVLSVLKLFTHDYGLLLNLYYLLSYPLSAIAALYVFRRLGLAPGLALTGSVLFAFLPFHLLRGEEHLFLSAYYFQPLLLLAVIWTATGHPLFRAKEGGTGWRSWRVTRDGAIALIACVLAAGDNPYWVFFGIIFLACAALLARYRFGHRNAVRTGAILIAILALALLVNLTPNFLYTIRHGPSAAAKRAPLEAEIYGLRVAQMVLPVSGHRVPLLRKVKVRYERQVANINENATASLGLFGTVGLAVSLACLIFSRGSPLLQALGGLNLAAFLWATVGGLGAVFNFVVWPQFRAYNRISVQIGFLSIAAFLLAASALLQRRTRLLRGSVCMGLLVALVMILGVFDQVPVRSSFLPDRALLERIFRQDETFVRQVEAAAPAQAMIFQLPYIAFPETAPRFEMYDYEQMRGFLHSRTLRWSYGAMKGHATDRWLAEVSQQPLPELAASVRQAGFSGILVNRLGYSDRAALLESQLGMLLNAAPIVDANGEMSYFPLDHPANR